MKRIAFLGSGAWASALANVLAENGHDVILYGIAEQEIEDIEKRHQNTRYFSTHKLHLNVHATMDMQRALQESDYVVVAVPSSAVRSVLQKAIPYLKHAPFILNVTKGFDAESEMTMIALIRSILPADCYRGLASLVGPSFASEVLHHQYTAIASVSQILEDAQEIQQLFSNQYFRVYTNTDEIGCSLAVSLKNVYAIASGILYGLGCFDNPHGALLTRALAEISRFVVAMGGQASTCLGLTGVGDLTLTCSSHQSRNFAAGEVIGKANSAKEFLKNNRTTVEGIPACKIAYGLSKKKGIYTPILDAVYRVLFEDESPKNEIEKMMVSPLKSE